MSVDGPDALSARELEVARAYADGQSYKEISRKLGIAPTTVRAHIRTIYRKTDVTSKIALARLLSSVASQQIPSGEAANSAQPVRVAVKVSAEIVAPEELASFARGLTEDIVSELTRYRRIVVLSAESSDKFFRERRDGLPARFGSDFAVWGTLRQEGERIRVTFSLEEVSKGQSIWSDRFEAARDEFFHVRDNVVGRLAATILGRTEAAVSLRASKQQPSSLDAYDCVMMGRLLLDGSVVHEAEAKELFKRATELDPKYALAHALLGHAYLMQWDHVFDGDIQALESALASAKMAVSIDPNDPFCQFVLGLVHLFCKNFDVAEAYYRRVAELAPNDAELIGEIALFSAYLGRPSDALSSLGRARHLDPNLDPAGFWRTEGLARFVDGQYGASVAAFERSVTTPFWIVAYQAAAEALQDRSDTARVFASRLLELCPFFRSQQFVDKEPLSREVDREALLAGLTKGGLPE